MLHEPLANLAPYDCVYKRLKEPNILLTPAKAIRRFDPFTVKWWWESISSLQALLSLQAQPWHLTEQALFRFSEAGLSLPFVSAWWLLVCICAHRPLIQYIILYQSPLLFWICLLPWGRISTESHPWDSASHKERMLCTPPGRWLPPHNSICPDSFRDPFDDMAWNTYSIPDRNFRGCPDFPPCWRSRGLIQRLQPFLEFQGFLPWWFPFPGHFPRSTFLVH